MRTRAKKSQANRSLVPKRGTLGPRLVLDDLPELVSLSLTAKFMGVSVPQVRGLIHSLRLEHVPIGRRLFVPKIAIPRFIAENTVQSCREETPAPVSASSKSETAF